MVTTIQLSPEQNNHHRRRQKKSFRHSKGFLERKEGTKERERKTGLVFCNWSSERELAAHEINSAAGSLREAKRRKLVNSSSLLTHSRITVLSRHLFLSPFYSWGNLICYFSLCTCFQLLPLFLFFSLYDVVLNGTSGSCCQKCAQFSARNRSMAYASLGFYGPCSAWLLRKFKK